MKFAQPFSGYEILERIGAGAMGTVFKARDRKLGRTVALKVLKPSLARNERYVERLSREARIVASLNHAHIVTGYELGEEGGYHFFVMEYIAGRSLKELLAEWGVFPEQQVLDVAMQVASALDHAHRRGVTHRDIKPGNILITEQNVVKLTDMGLAKGPADLTITRDGATMGTPQYSSPEQLSDAQTADIRSDLYSLGATLYHMITGQPPFAGDTLAQMIHKVMHNRAPSAAELNPGISDGLSLVIRKLLAKDPDLRYQTPAELLADLRRVERAEVPDVDVRRLDREVSGRGAQPRVAVWIASGVLVVTMLATGLSWWAWSGNDDELDAASREAAIGREIADRLARADSLGERLRLLQAAAAGATREGAGVIAGMRLSLDNELRAAIDDVIDRYLEGERRAVAEAWFETPEHWRDPDRFFTEYVEPDLVTAVGLRSTELPNDLRVHWVRTADRLRARMRSWRDALGEGFRTAFEDLLARDVTRAWTTALERRDFAAAEQAVGSTIDHFFARPGAPTRAQLPDDLRVWVAEREQHAVTQALERIEAEESQQAGELVRHVDDALAALDRRREQVSPARMLGLLDGLRHELATYPPPDAFRAAHNPWREVDGKLQRFADKVAADQAFEEAKDLEHAVRRAYRALLLTGSARDARAWLTPLELAAASNAAIRDQHVELLAAAEDALRGLLGALLGDSPRIVVDPRRVGGNGRIRIAIARLEDGYALRGTGGADGVEVSPLQVFWPDLIERVDRGWLGAPGSPERERREAGLALWRLASDDAASLVALDPSTRSFFANHVTDPVDRARARGLEDRSAMQLLQELRREFERPERDVSTVAAALRAFRAEHGEDALEGDAAGFLREVDGWVQRRSDQIALTEALRARVPAGVAVAVDEARHGVLTYPPAAVTGDRQPPGWVRFDNRLEFTGDDVDLRSAQASQQLAIESPFATSNAASLTLDLRFPALPDRPRLYLFQVHGALVALALLRDGTVAAVAGSSGLLERQNELRSLLRDAIEAAIAEPAVRVVAEASHRLRIDWLATKHRVRIAGTLDGVELASVTEPRPRRLPARFVLLPLQPLRIDAIELAGDL